MLDIRAGIYGGDEPLGDFEGGQLVLVHLRKADYAHDAEDDQHEPEYGLVSDRTADYVGDGPAPFL